MFPSETGTRDRNNSFSSLSADHSDPVVRDEGRLVGHFRMVTGLLHAFPPLTNRRRGLHTIPESLIAVEGDLYYDHLSLIYEARHTYKGDTISSQGGYA